MPHRAFSAAQLRAMRAEEEVVFQDELLPSLRQACADRQLEWKQDEEMARQQLRPGLRPSEYECAKLRALRQELECPICRAVPRASELVFICTAHHHVCFTCLLAILRSAHQSGAEPACPMRCGALYIHDAPAPAFRHVLDALDTPQTPLSETYQVYTGLHRCGYYTGSLYDTHTLTHFVTELVDIPDMWQRAQKCVHLHRHHVAYSQALPSPPACSQKPGTPLPDLEHSVSDLLQSEFVAEEEAEEEMPAYLTRYPPPPRSPPPPPARTESAPMPPLLYFDQGAPPAFPEAAAEEEAGSAPRPPSPALSA